MFHRLQITYDRIRTFQRMKLHGHARRNMQEAIEKSYKKILRQYPMFLKALVTSTNACDIIAEDRANHILLWNTTDRKSSMMT
jgi:hypothetical protein